MNSEELATVFRCDGAWLYGILSVPEKSSSRGILIAVGGPQYRIGSHRQFTLLARQLATLGIPALRFDFRGMGDSEGNSRTFEEVEEDLRYAIDDFFSRMPSLKEVVILGLCDAASAALFYGYQDSRVTGLVLLNPWIRTEESSARTYLKHYYANRLFQPGLWRKIRSGNFDFAAAGSSLLRTLRTAFLPKKNAKTPSNGNIFPSSSNLAPLPDRMLLGLDCFTGRILLVISGNDLTAREFLDVTDRSPKWQKLLTSSNMVRYDLPDADHTFSRRKWRENVGNRIYEWIRSW